MSSSSILPAPSQNTSTHFLTPIQHLITIKLNRDNYLLWKARIVPYLKGQHLFSFIDGSLPAPPSFLPPTSTEITQTTLNPTFVTWQSQDQMIFSALILSLSETILAYMVKCTTSRDTISSQIHEYPLSTCNSLQGWFFRCWLLSSIHPSHRHSCCDRSTPPSPWSTFVSSCWPRFRLWFSCYLCSNPIDPHCSWRSLWSPTIPWTPVIPQSTFCWFVYSQCQFCEQKLLQ